MFRYLAGLFAADRTAPAPTAKARLALTAMEDRCAPAALANPGLAAGIPAIPPGGAQAIIIHFTPSDAPGIIVVGSRGR